MANYLKIYQSLFIHIVTYNSENYIDKCLQAIVAQNDVVMGKDFFISVTDNASTDSTQQVLEKWKANNSLLQLTLNKQNIGFAGGHNQGVYNFLNHSKCSHILILNPDVALEPSAIRSFLDKISDIEEKDNSIGGVAPLLLRADKNLEPLEPKIVDSTGITFTKSYRHFDRYAELKADKSDLLTEEYIDGISGACMFLNRKFINSVSFLNLKRETEVYSVFPELKYEAKRRVKLFDEAFFAYREDAELSIRGKRLGWTFKFIPKIVAYHVRQVTPEKRAMLSKEINLHGVRNRFLLQLNTFNWKIDLAKVVPGLIIRNLVVIFGVLLVEKSSIKAFNQLRLLFFRALERNKTLYSNRNTDNLNE